MALYRSVLSGIYSDRPVICHVAWSETGRIETLADAALEAALAELTEA
jgi:hypothetical protein